MPQLSTFTSCGLLACSSRPSRARAIYDAMVAALGDNYDMTEGAYHGAKIHAWALELGRVDAIVARMGNQYDPAKISDLLPSVEREHGLAPGAHDTLTDRRAALAVRKLLPEGARLLNVEEGLRALLGSDFIGIAVEASPVADPVDPAAQNSGDWSDRWPERRVYRLTGPATSVVTETVGYEAVAPTTKPLAKGDHVVLTPDNPDISERVLVQGATSSTITFSHLRAHATGAAAVLGGLPMWRSNRRHCAVQVSATAAVDAEKRRIINDLMSRVARVVSTWDISAPSLGPFMAGSSLLSCTPFEA